MYTVKTAACQLSQPGSLAHSMCAEAPTDRPTHTLCAISQPFRFFSFLCRSDCFSIAAPIVRNACFPLARSRVHCFVSEFFFFFFNILWAFSGKRQWLNGAQRLMTYLLRLLFAFCRRISSDDCKSSARMCMVHRVYRWFVAITDLFIWNWWLSASIVVADTQKNNSNNDEAVVTSHRSLSLLHTHTHTRSLATVWRQIQYPSKLVNRKFVSLFARWNCWISSFF